MIAGIDISPPVGAALIAGVVAVVGGFLAQYLYAAKIARVTHSDAQAERLRQERVLAYSEFAGALIEYRLAQLARWHAEHPGTSSAYADRHDVRDAARGRRVAAWTKYYRVTLLAGDQDIAECAQRALACADAIADSVDWATMIQSADALRDTHIPDFLQLTGLQVRPQ